MVNAAISAVQPIGGLKKHMGEWDWMTQWIKVETSGRSFET
jgi:hypothetical protein